jgi:hypothetical protein
MKISISEESSISANYKYSLRKDNKKLVSGRGKTKSEALDNLNPRVMTKFTDERLLSESKSLIIGVSSQLI